MRVAFMKRLISINMKEGLIPNTIYTFKFHSSKDTTWNKS